MPSPKRIFRSLSTADVEAQRDAALARVLSGSFTSTSGGGKSSTRQFEAASDIVFEATYELAVRNGTAAPSRTTQDFSELQEHNVTNT